MQQVHSNPLYPGRFILCSTWMKGRSIRVTRKQNNTFWGNPIEVTQSSFQFKQSTSSNVKVSLPVENVPLGQFPRINPATPMVKKIQEICVLSCSLILHVWLRVAYLLWMPPITVFGFAFQQVFLLLPQTGHLCRNILFCYV